MHDTVTMRYVKGPYFAHRIKSVPVSVAQFQNVQFMPRFQALIKNTSVYTIQYCI